MRSSTSSRPPRSRSCATGWAERTSSTWATGSCPPHRPTPSRGWWTPSTGSPDRRARRPAAQRGWIDGMTESQTNASRLRELNATLRYTMWSVFRVADQLGPAPRDKVTAEVEALAEQLAGKDVVVRGTYDVSALR